MVIYTSTETNIFISEYVIKISKNVKLQDIVW